jgi:hypothetical protein
MKHLAIVTVLVAVPAVAAADDRRVISESFDLAPGQQVRVEFPVGELRFAGVEGTRVSVEIELTCDHGGSRCAEAIERVELESDSTEARLLLEIEKEPKWSWDDLEMDAVIRLPADRALTVDMGVGSLDVEGMRGEVSLDLGVGQVEVTMPAASVGSVRLDAGVGETSLRLPEGRVDERRSLLIGGEIRWDEGKGGSDVWVDVGVGEVNVRLEG